MRVLGSRLVTLRVALMGSLLVLALPGAVSAAPADDACAALRAQTYTATLPSGARTIGTHRVQWKSAYTDIGTGELVVDDSIVNSFTVDPSAPAYRNDVLIRLFRNTTILAAGEVIDVTSIRPTQDARLYVNVSWLRDEPFFTGAFRLWYRYETTTNHWSSYVELPASPVQSFCVEFTSSIWKKGYGWS